MPRAKRYHIPGYVWHITHRCHKQEFLLKFARDRRRYRYWLFEAKKRYGLIVINYIVTSNHIHLLVADNGARDVIPRSMQLVAGRTGQEFNQRKGRKGAFWEDRYHATAVETDRHLLECLIYIDMNMVRAGAVMHPCQWDVSGYHEIQKPKQRYCVIDHHRLISLLGQQDSDTLKNTHHRWIEKALEDGHPAREEQWTQSLAVGSRQFVDSMKRKLGSRAKYRSVEKVGPAFQLHEDPMMPYSANFDPEIEGLSIENGYDLNASV